MNAKRTIKIFIEVNGLLELEQTERKGEVKELLFNLWNTDKNNVAKLCRLISECWYEL